ncbi:MAG: CRISPR-associated endonuclease Cas3'' [Candidatus Terraquivivens tikiterensis]|uniref:CRISPR-associated endonuclease Cas3 n=1 Tax=Candidatus Terraquivivens tikiterensis TaxID=1980982 RepID=A0A2R7Y536_9ARCH|nr:MAG: CRISPR-associated endonuclease Cas3'' [Candidatus Terraquivivens tikiterensis]
MAITSEILSYFLRYKDGKEEKELLRDHIQGALNHVERIENKRIGRFVLKNLGVSNFGQLLRYSIILHDAGKAFFQSEKHIRHEDNVEYLSFSGHEFFSALIAECFVDEKIRQTYDFSYSSVVFAVLYHHHAMNFEARKKAINSVAKIVESGINTTHLEELKRTLSEFLDRDDRGILAKFMDRLPNKFTRNAVEVVQDKLFKRLVQNPQYVRLKKLSYALLDALIACDYLAAQKREAGRSAFFDAVKDFYDAWLI